jgi:hypothetical protein
MYQVDARCECGVEWRFETDDPDVEMAECLACGADTFDVTIIGGLRYEP